MAKKKMKHYPALGKIGIDATIKIAEDLSGCQPAEVEFTKEVRRKIDEMDEGKIEHPRETEDAESLEEYRKIWWNVLLALKGAEK